MERESLLTAMKGVMVQAKKLIRRQPQLIPAAYVHIGDDVELIHMPYSTKDEEKASYEWLKDHTRKALLLIFLEGFMFTAVLQERKQISNKGIFPPFQQSSTEKNHISVLKITEGSMDFILQTENLMIMAEGFTIILEV